MPAGHYFAVGRSADSFDSRYFGLIREGQVLDRRGGWDETGLDLSLAPRRWSHHGAADPRSTISKRSARRLSSFASRAAPAWCCAISPIRPRRSQKGSCRKAGRSPCPTQDN
ncbi:MAG: S26 family signal peptidase [Alphaproteobacteria bacterium]